ncbi:MAG: serine/threonine-protein phosphatase [Calditrichaeota bacterium]|nr:MAG: serine/threonine-protein phosphatase [Calditrichota bacterium]
MISDYHTMDEYSFVCLSDGGAHRKQNEDSSGCFSPMDFGAEMSKGKLFIVADGIGGLSNGREASQLAVKIIAETYFRDPSRHIEKSINSAFQAANSAIYSQSQSEETALKMGTTATALVVTDKHRIIAHVGDSRAIWIRQRKIRQLTREHTRVHDLLKAQIISEEEAANHPEKSVLIRALGIHPSVKVDVIAHVPFVKGDLIIICTDGFKLLNNEDILRISAQYSLQQAAEKMVQVVRERGEKDNATLIMIANHQQNFLYVLLKKRMFAWPMLIFLGLLAVIVSAHVIMQHWTQHPRHQHIPDVESLARAVDGSPADTPGDEALSKANAFLLQAYDDSALVYFNQALLYDSTNFHARNGLVTIFYHYLRQGEVLKSAGRNTDARFYFEKALSIYLDPSVISGAETGTYEIDRPDSQSSASSADTVDYTAPLSLPLEDQFKIDEFVQESEYGFGPMLWDAEKLNPADIIMDDDHVVFSASAAEKRLYLNKAFQNAEIKITCQIEDSDINKEFGILIEGFNEKGVNNDVFIYGISSNGTLFFRHVIQGSSRTLCERKAFKDAFSALKPIELKIKLIGPSALLYFNSSLFFFWQTDDMIRGRIGIYADDWVGVKFSDFSLRSSI